MIRVYCAGPMSSPDPIKFMDNLRRGTRVSTELLLNGFAVFSPFIDIALFMQLREGESIPIETIQQHSLKWLEVSDVVLVLDGWESSKGTLRELARANELNIPIYHSINDLLVRDLC